MQPPRVDAADPVGFRVWRVAGFRTMDRAHTHPDIEINCVATGFIEYLFAGRRVRLDAGQLGVFWGGVPHQLEGCSRAGRGVWLTIPIADFLRWQLPGGLAGDLMGGGFAQMPFAPAVAGRWLGDFLHDDAPRRRVMLLELEAALHRLALRSDPGGPPARRAGAPANGTSHVARVTAHIARHYADDLSVAQVAAAVRLNPRYLARIFKAGTRLTVHDYLTRLRFAHAQRLLATTSLRVVDVALQSGFGSLAGFYTTFSRMSAGMTPHRYRRKLPVAVS